MNVLENYTRQSTELIEGLSLNDNEQLVPKLSNRTLTQGTPVDLYKVRQSTTIPDFSINKSWKQYPLNLHDILNGTGTYIILIKYGSALYSGIMTYYDDVSADIEDEIQLHVGGTFTRVGLSETEGRIYAKIAQVSNSTPQLFLASSKNEDNVNANITIKFRKLL